MFRKDYIMRMIEDFIKAMAKIIMMREMKSYSDARVELDALSKLVTGFGIDHLRSLGAAGIKYVFSQNKESEAEKIFCSAKILKSTSAWNLKAFCTFGQKRSPTSHPLALSTYLKMNFALHSHNHQVHS